MVMKLRIQFSWSIVLFVGLFFFGLSPVRAAAYNAGYRAMSFTSGGTTYQASVWYPSNNSASSYTYPSSTITSLVALNGQVAPGVHPTVIFSHGDTGCATQSIFLTESFAHAGYVVAAVNYPDAS